MPKFAQESLGHRPQLQPQKLERPPALHRSAPFNIDNNTAERAIRAIGVGRKNWLFLGSDDGGRAAAIHFSLIASTKRHGLDLFVYLRDLRRRIPTHPNRQIESLLPDHCAKTTE